MKKTFLFIVLFACSFALAELTNGLVAYYPLDGNTNDFSGNHLDGTSQNSPTWVSGVSGQALNFNGSQGVYINGSAGHSSPLNLYNTNVTLSAWIKLPIGGGGGSIVARAKPHYVTYKLGSSSTTAIINNYRSPTHWNLYSDPILQTDTWHHLVGIFDRDSSIGKIFIDGVERGVGPLTIDPASCDGITKIGCRNDTTDQAFTGQIDELYIYNRVLRPLNNLVFGEAIWPYAA